MRRSARWAAFARPSALPVLAGIMTIALCSAGCASSRKTRLETARAETVRILADSTVSEVRQVWREAVPQSEVWLALPADSLMRLPPQAGYSGRNGQASVTVRRDRDVILVHASCDSLQVLAEYYERTSSLWQECCEELAALHETETRQRSDPMRTFFAGFGVGIAITAEGMTIIKNKLKNDN